MNIELAQILFSISLKARILRAWQQANRAQDQEFSENEMFTLELISDFPPITEKGLCKILGLSFSSVGELVKQLVQKGTIDPSEKARGKPLVLTKCGEQILKRLKERSAARLSYLFDSTNNPLTDSEIEILKKIFRKVENNVEHQVQTLVFDRYTL